MQKYSSQAGIAPLVIVVIAAIVLGGGWFIFQSRQEAAMEKEAMMEKESSSPSPSPSDVMMKKDDGAMMQGDVMLKFSGQVLAGDEAKLLVFNKADYDAAVKANKLVVLYFYANWCPICKAEFPLMQAAFNELSTDAVVGFRVNFNDNETDADEKALASAFGVAYQHTKVFVKGGQRVLKSPESWTQVRYLSEINVYLK